MRVPYVRRNLSEVGFVGQQCFVVKTPKLVFEPPTFGKPVGRSHYSSKDCSLGGDLIRKLCKIQTHAYQVTLNGIPKELIATDQYGETSNNSD